MHIARRWLHSLYLTLLLTALTPLPSAAQSAPVAPVASQAAAQPATQANSQAYSLPPDKLAKAITFNRILNILDILGGLWGLAVLWLLLSTRAAAGLEAWMQRLMRRRWLQLARPPGQPPLRHQRAGLERLGCRSRQSARRRFGGRARAAALQLDGAYCAATLLAVDMGSHGAAHGAHRLWRTAARADLRQV